MTPAEVLARAMWGPSDPRGPFTDDWDNSHIMLRIAHLGFSLVPTKPTGSMVIAGGEAQQRSIGSWGEPKLVWAAMIDEAAKK